MANMSETRELHYRYNIIYLLIILSAVIVLLLTVQWGSIEDLTGYISFGLTLTSLFLSLIAIFFTVISNFTFSQNLGTLREATTSISNTSKNLAEMTAVLDAKLAEIPVLIRNVENKLDDTRKEIKQQAEQRVDTEKAPPVSPQPLEEKNTNAERKQKSTFTLPTGEFFLQASSLSGLQILYVTQKSFSTRISFDLKKICSLAKMDQNYSHGYLVASSAMGIVHFTLKDDIINVVSMVDLPDLRDMLVSRINDLLKEDPALWKDDDPLNSRIMPIDKFFEE